MLSKPGSITLDQSPLPPQKRQRLMTGSEDREPDPRPQEQMLELATTPDIDLAGNTHSISEAPLSTLDANALMPQRRSRGRPRNTPGPSMELPVMNVDHAEALPTGQTSNAWPVSRTQHGEPFVAEDDALLLQLRDVEGLAFRDMRQYFNGRTEGSLATRHNTLKKRARPAQAFMPAESRGPGRDSGSDDENGRGSRPKRVRRQVTTGTASGFISWHDLSTRVLDEDDAATAAVEDQQAALPPAKPQQPVLHPTDLILLLRYRETGVTRRPGWVHSPNRITAELQQHATAALRMKNHFMSTSGDVTCLAWSPKSNKFAAGSIAISDDRSQQYNSGRNLVLGDTSTSILHELSEHHVPRPIVTAANNVNSLHSMHVSQDPRLFMTVAAVGFSPSGGTLYTGGSDCVVRNYDVRKRRCRYSIEHSAPVSLLAVSNNGMLATGCHQSADRSVRIYNCHKTHAVQVAEISPSSTDVQSALSLFPSALKWGAAHHHRKLLLAGFSSDSQESERDAAGETRLYNVEAEQYVHLSTVTRNVFDVAWNPSPSSASPWFAIASTPDSQSHDLGTRSVVQLFAPGQGGGARRVLEWQCPAFDINDVIFCPHDDRLIAAGATNGKVYVWDQRFVGRRSESPLLSLSHGASLNVLDHDRDCEVTDTGVRFLSWGSTSSRMYSGSSDGRVKVWNPYRADAFIGDAVTLQSAIMSGAFSTDYRELLVGEESGRINLLATLCADDDGESQQPPSRTFSLCSAPGPTVAMDAPSHATACALLTKGEIEYRPMGAFPKRQAVQGSNYHGPYLRPSSADYQRAEANYSNALDDRNKAAHAMHDNTPEPDEKTLSDAVQKAQDALNHLQLRDEDANVWAPKAAATQRAFRAAEIKSTGLHVKPCSVDCSYLPAMAEDDGQVPDSEHSALRIPDVLRLSAKQIDIDNSDCGQLHQLGLASKCPYCNPQLRQQTKMSEHLCSQRLRNLKRTIRIPQSTASMSCFRCERSLVELPGIDQLAPCLYCEACDLAWQPNVLGYELVHSDGATKRVKGTAQSDDEEDSEVVRHASQWQISTFRRGTDS